MEVSVEELKVAKYPTYKDSRVKSIGEIPGHWEVFPLFSVASLKSVTNLRDRDLLSVYLDRGVIKFSDVTEKRTNVTSLDLSNYQAVNPGDFVLNNQQAWRGSVGVSKYEGIVSPAYLVLLLSSKFDSNFADYFFRDIAMVSQYLICSKGVGTIQRNLYWNYLRRSNISIPPKEEQIAIAQFLDRKIVQIDKAIAIKEKQIILLKERRQILIHRAVTRGLNPDVPMKDSGVEWIGEIPEHWEIVSNKTLFHERNEPGDENLPLLMVSIHSAVSSEEVSDEDNIRGKIRIEDKSSYKRVKVGDIVFNMMRAWQGGIGAVRVEGMVSPAYVVAKPTATFNSDFFEYQYRTAAFIKQMDRVSKGITDFRKRLYWNEFKQLCTILPPVKEQLEIANFITTLNNLTDEAITSKLKEIGKLKEYKASLINSAVTGKIKVC